MEIRDTLTCRDVRIGPPRVRIYLCGVTVYDYSHIGHARTIITFDILRRHLESKGAQVELVQNFTDVDDKIIDRARAEGASALEISRRYIRDYHDGFDKLNVMRATRYPRATEHIEEMRVLIGDLVRRKMAYITKNGVYFAVSGFPQYGKLSKKNTDELEAGARVQIDAGKRDPLDFALWKFSDSEPSWDSPWGRGRPGWHIECSAMSLKYLGADFEIHGGGRDLIFPHHENEIAQSESHTGMPLARVWMHVGMITIGGEKMSKSSGNIKSVRRMLEEWSPNVIRLFCIGGHYSKPIDYSKELLGEHKTNWNRARLAYHRLVQHGGGTGKSGAGRFKDDFEAALDDNLNTHLALEAFYGLVTHLLGHDMSQDAACDALAVFEHMMNTLGLQIRRTSPEERVQIEALVSRRDECRDQKRYGEADRIRDELGGMGIELTDEAGRTVWMRTD